MVKHSWISMQQEHQCLFRMLLELSQLLAGFKFPDSNTASTILVSRLWQVKRITAWNSVHDISICNINMFVMTLKELCLAANDQGTQFVGCKFPGEQHTAADWITDADDTQGSTWGIIRQVSFMPSWASNHIVQCIVCSLPQECNKFRGKSIWSTSTLWAHIRTHLWQGIILPERRDDNSIDCCLHVLTCTHEMYILLLLLLRSILFSQWCGSSFAFTQPIQHT